MGRKLIPIELTESEESELRSMLQKGTHNSREYKRAHILLKLQSGEKPTAISLEVYCSPAMVKAVKKRYLSGGLERALKDAPRSGAPAKVTEYHEADITAIACTIAPKGRGKWTAELLSDELVKLGYEEGHSPSTVRRILKKVNITPKKGSWLNVSEIEFAALSKQCLDGRRIPTLEKLDEEAQTWGKDPNTKEVKIKWSFTKRQSQKDI